MTVSAKSGVSFFIILYGILHFITYFFPNGILHVILSISGLGIIIFSIFIKKATNLKMPLALVGIGVMILFLSDYDVIEGIHHGLLLMRNMIGLLIIVPLISWVLKEEPYMESIVSYGNRFLNSSRKFYFGMISFVQIIAFFLLFGSIQMVYHFVNEVLPQNKSEAWENYKATALLRGFALSVMWVISIPSFIFVVEVMDASLYLSILQGFGMMLVGVIIALLFSHYEEKKYGVDLTEGLQSEFKAVLETNHYPVQTERDMKEFIILFTSLFGSVFIVQGLVDIELLVMIPLMVIIWILIYYLYKKRIHRLWQYTKEHAKDGITYGAYQLSVMLGAGIMIFALNEIGFAKVVVDGVYSIQETVPFFNLLYFLPFIIIILGFFGLGPLTVMALVGGLLGGLDLSYPPEIVVLTVSSGSAISILLSPLILPVISLSNANGLSVIKNGIGFNWKYAIVLYVIVQLYVQAVVW